MSRTWERASVRVLLLALVAVGTACGDGPPDADASPEAAPTPVRTVPVTISTEPAPIYASGTVAAGAEMNLAFKIPGYVAAVLVDEGDRVEAEQVLARLRQDEVDAQVRAAEGQADAAAKNLDRMERLIADSVVTEATLEQARDANERAQAALQVARFNQTFATIRAPVAGRVLRRMIEVSEFTGAGVPAFRLGSTGSGWVVRVAVADRDVVRLSLGDSADVRFSALGDEGVAGRVSEIADAADARSGTFEVEVLLRGSPAGLRSGMVARVTLMPSRSEPLAFLPTQALIDTNGLEAAVFVVSGDRVRRQPVRVVRIGVESVGVSAADLEGETVVTDGAAYLRDGDRIDDRTAALPAPGN